MSEVSLCESCGCMTKTVDNNGLLVCGKCRSQKEDKFKTNTGYKWVFQKFSINGGKK